MYEEFYHLTGSPFLLTPDARFFFESRQHGRAIAHLTFGLAQGEGFVIVTGEVGAGKTTLVERLWSQLDRDTFTIVRITTTQLSGDALFRLAMAGFGVASEGADKAAMILGFEAVLHRHRSSGRRCLLVVDEVQNLPVAALEELRMLSNLTQDGRAGLQTLLLGQPQFRRMLASPDLDQLRQRVLASYHLGPLAEAETRAYVEHRLRTVGWHGGNPGWDDAAFAALHQRTGGIPRRINRLCARTLLYGALEQSARVTEAMVGGTADELDHDLDGVAGAGATGSSIGLAALRQALDGVRAQDDLAGRVERLEQRVERREKVLERLLDALAVRA